jgi:hypothetical protein
MGCSHLLPGKKEIELEDEKYFKTKYEKFIYKLKVMREREKEEKFIEDIDW